MIKIDLSNNERFEDNELIINKKNTFIFGRNGTGKSTIAKEIKKLGDKYDVFVFQGFDNIIDKNERLNTVLLGEENIEINTKIESKKKVLKEYQDELDKIKNTISPPKEGEENFYSRRESARNEYDKINRSLEQIYSGVASDIKNISNPSIASTSYNKNNIKSEMSLAKIISEKEIEYAKSIIMSEIKIVPSIKFPQIILEQYLDDVNKLLVSSVEEYVQIERLKNDVRRNFAKIGLDIHNEGDTCAFCGNKISSDVFRELKGYFSANEVKEFGNLIENKISQINNVIESLDKLSIKIDSFYSIYREDVIKIQADLEEAKKKYKLSLNILKTSLEEKQKKLFEPMKKVTIKLLNELDDVAKEFNDLRQRNNSNDLEYKKQEAEKKLRFHYIKKFGRARI